MRCSECVELLQQPDSLLKEREHQRQAKAVETRNPVLVVLARTLGLACLVIGSLFLILSVYFVFSLQQGCVVVSGLLAFFPMVLAAILLLGIKPYHILQIDTNPRFVWQWRLLKSLLVSLALAGILSLVIWAAQLRPGS